MIEWLQNAGWFATWAAKMILLIAVCVISLYVGSRLIGYGVAKSWQDVQDKHDNKKGAQHDETE